MMHLFLALVCAYNGPLPDRTCTPGAIDPRVTQENIHTTICRAGYTRAVRPPSSEMLKIKIAIMGSYRSELGSSNYELDHLVPLELGGSSSSLDNLWPQPYEGVWNARLKDRLENRLHQMVCDGRMELSTAQHAIAYNWVGAVHLYLSDEDPTTHTVSGRSRRTRWERRRW